jgi:hypothetical protein
MPSKRPAALVRAWGKDQAWAPKLPRACPVAYGMTGHAHAPELVGAAAHAPACGAVRGLLKMGGSS